MCGLAGSLDLARSTNAEVLRATAEVMAGQLVHRGPDDAGTWVDAAHGIALAHRRLAVVDLSPSGHQPMVSASGRLVIAFNGEIYNFPRLRAELVGQGYPLRGRSDTEALIGAIETWGIAAALDRVEGMFAFALWDRAQARLTLARDRFGEKPLYYGLFGDTVLFGSELQALRSHPAFRGEIDRGSLTLLLRHGYIPAPHSVFRGVSKLPPGSTITLGRGSVSLPKPEVYWSVLDAVEAGARSPWTGDDREAVDELERRLSDAVGLRCDADVPLGAFLSGGIDSSTVVALMRQHTDRVRTFTIGFSEHGFDESAHARAVAKYLGTDHTELSVGARDALAVVPHLPTMFGEPFADSSQIPTYLVSRLAREHVTVALSGDGGDELFAGYERYRRGARAVALARPVPGVLRRLVARRVEVTPAWGPRVGRIASVLARDGRVEQYRELVSNWVDPAQAMLAPERRRPEPATALADHAAFGDLSSIRCFQALDLMTYLPDDILAKVDRASMAVSLEARVPMLDRRVVELALSFPDHLNVRGREGKWALRQVLYRHVDPALVERPKMGFGVPMAAWLRGPLKDWASDLLDERVLRDGGHFDPAAVRHVWNGHQAGTKDGSWRLWPVLMFQAWLAVGWPDAGVAEAELLRSNTNSLQPRPSPTLVNLTSDQPRAS